MCLSVEYPADARGYHHLDSVFQEIDLFDRLSFSVVEKNRTCTFAETSLGSSVCLDCPDVDVSVEDNLIFKAIEAAEKIFDYPIVSANKALEIKVEKNIPSGGGLGGGSSDAAATLRTVAKISGVDSQDERILEVARSLGADVAFFMYGQSALMGHYGDVLVRQLPLFSLPLVLMGDEKGCSTPAVYRMFDQSPVDRPDAEALAAAMEHGASDVELAGLCKNNLQEAAFSACSGLEERVRYASTHPDVLSALVTGSGSTSFAICPDEEAAKRFAHDVAPRCAWVRLVHAC